MFTCRVTPDKQAEFLASVADVMERARWLPGCLDCRLVTNVAGGGGFSLLCEWSGREGLDWFLQSAEFRVLKGMRILMEDDPSLIVEEVVSRAGISMPRTPRGVDRSSRFPRSTR
jgi:quinol monooxygenase YgiN